jgi:hypothetical protein
MESKKPWLSKTLIVNTIVAILAVSGQSDKVGLDSDKLMMILSGVNIVLRLVTKDKIGLNA